MSTPTDTQSAAQAAADKAAADAKTAAELDWRGVAAENSDEITGKVGGLLRTRSRRLLGSLLRPHKRSLWIAITLMLIDNFVSLAGPALVSIGIDQGIPGVRRGDYTPLILVVVGMIVAAIADAILRYFFLMRAGRIGQALLLDLRRRVFWHFQKLSLSFHEKYTSGRVISRLTSDMDSLQELIDAGLDGLVTAVLSVVSIAVILLVLDVPLGLVSLASLPFLWWLSWWFRKHSTVTYRRTREKIALLIVQFVESLGGIRAVKAFRREPRNEVIFDQLNDDFRDANSKSMELTAWFVGGIKLLGNIVIAAVLVYGGYRVIDNKLEIGVLTAFILYLRRFFDPMQDLSMFYNSYQSATAALEKLSGVLEEEHPVALTSPRGKVTFTDVTFGYNDKVVLPHLNLSIPAGQTVALVGATGAGKSTLARLMARFYDPKTGVLDIDGVDLRQVSDDDLRRAVVMVTQESFLFSGTVADNIAFGRPGASREQVIEAARTIGAHGFISALPEGYDTDVRKRGGRLSAGQRQLVSFARAFLADPAVLILDEATSSLDVPTERLVQHALRTILAERTALIIAHRLSTVEIADRVLVMEAGRLIEDGTPDELIRGKGQFAGLHQAWADSLV
jgi:ATP-binding cassette, subfamily B, bacterial